MVGHVRIAPLRVISPVYLLASVDLLYMFL